MDDRYICHVQMWDDQQINHKILICFFGYFLAIYYHISLVTIQIVFALKFVSVYSQGIDTHIPQCLTINVR